jgi:hypothetical protein
LSWGEDIALTVLDRARFVKSGGDQVLGGERQTISSLRLGLTRGPILSGATLRTMRRRLGPCVVLLALALAGCAKASEESEAKQWPKPEPPPQRGVTIPAELSISVTVDGEPRDPITTAGLQKARPDFSDADRKAWRIATLIEEAIPAGTVEAASPTGFSVKFQHPTPDGFEPVLFLTRRGEVIVAAVNPKDPFPRYHGQGGRLARAGDPMPHVAPVAKLEITRSRP